MSLIKIAFVGDFFPGGVLVNQEKFYDERVKEVLMSADLRVATLECALGSGDSDGYTYDEEKMARPDWRNIIWAPDECIKRLKELHIDVVTIANNHIYDLGEKGLINTIRLLDENGIKHCGAGLNIEEASKPAVVEIKGKRIAFLGFMPYWWEAPHAPSASKSGINQLHIEKVESDVINNKKKYDYVIVLPHWGIEHTHYPTIRERRFAIRIIKAGADGVVGSHTHTVQPLIKLKGKPVCFSLGNFIFPDFYMSADRPVCYPSKEEMETIPSVLGYPKYPNQIIKSIWKRNNRIGAVCQLEIEDSINASLSLVKMSDECILNTYTDNKLASKLNFIAFLMSSPFFVLFMKGRSLSSRIVHFLNR